MILNFIYFFIILSVLVFVHELGHFLAAKRAGIVAEEFGFGYPPKIWGKKIKGTIYSINWLPFGGFVRLRGEDLEEGKPEKGTFWAQSKKARTAVIVAGVVANFLLATVCFSLVYAIVGVPVKTDKVIVVGIASNSPAEKMGFADGDVIFSVDDKQVVKTEDFTGYVAEKKGRQITVGVRRKKDGQEELYLKGIPRSNPPQNEGALGVVVSNMEVRRFPVWQMPYWGIVEGTKEALGWTKIIVAALAKMIVELVGKGVVPKDVSGPLGIYKATSTVAQSGFVAILQFVGILSINLAVMNILPLPALDGGRLMFIVYEIIARRRPKPSIERWVNTVGMAALIALIILVSIGDVKRYFF